MISATYRILSPTVTIYGTTRPILGLWTVTGVYTDGAANVRAVEICNRGWPVGDRDWPIEIEIFNEIPKELIK
jgi:hypothetical protein